MRSNLKLQDNSRGFTVVELMIATLVFGLVLMVVTTAILQFTRVYYKGITEANVQETARNIADQIVQGIQFNGGGVTPTPDSPTPGSYYAFCVGNKQYSFTPGYQLSDTPSPSKFQTYHVLAVDNVAGCTSTPAQNVRNASISGRELIGPGMRLSRLQVTNLGTNLYKVSVRIVYGDDDLINTPTGSAASCKTLHSGTEFCAASDITTTVVKRVQ